MQALTETEAEQCRAFGIRAPVRVLPNGVDIEAIDRAPRAALRAELSLPAHSVLFLFLGRLFPKKGLDLLVPAFGRIAADHHNVHLLLAGHDGDSGYRGTVERLVAESGATDRIRLLGELHGARKFAVLKDADAFVLPSYSEGLPVAALEAMACRLPVVLTANCNLPEVGFLEAGWTVEPTLDAVVQGLRVALRSSTERGSRGANGRRLVSERFTWSRIATDSLGLYGTTAERLAS
jgi:glycosyltransferase involved in cell wall biosynthesis